LPVRGVGSAFTQQAYQKCRHAAVEQHCARGAARPERQMFEHFDQIGDESAFNRLKDFRRIATRYDRLARNYLASVCLAAAPVW
jgi:transposase